MLKVRTGLIALPRSVCGFPVLRKWILWANNQPREHIFFLNHCSRTLWKKKHFFPHPLSTSHSPIQFFMSHLVYSVVVPTNKHTQTGVLFKVDNINTHTTQKSFDSHHIRTNISQPNYAVSGQNAIRDQVHLSLGDIILTRLTHAEPHDATFTHTQTHILDPRNIHI